MNKNFDFDLGLGSNRPRSMNDQKNQTFCVNSSYSSSTTQPKPSWQANKPSWTHQPAATNPTRSGLDGPASMVGDIFGKSWDSGSGSGSGSGIGIVNKNPNLFGDLVSSALGQGNSKGAVGGGGGGGNVPLKSANPTWNQSAYSMGGLSDSLPKADNSAKNRGSWGSEYGNSSNVNVGVNRNVNVNVSTNRNANLGGPSMKSMSGGGVGGGMTGNRDPFGSLVDFGSKKQQQQQKQPSGVNFASNVSKGNGSDDTFGDFQNVAKPNAAASFPTGAGLGANSNDFMGSNGASSLSVDDFAMPSKGFASQNEPPAQTPGGDPLDMFFSSSSGGAATATGGAGAQQFSELDDWGLDSGFGGGVDDVGGSTTELEGLPPPPAGVTASAAKSKGMDNQKQGQYADAIKWLSWAVVLLAKTDDEASTMEVLSCRASCYKEVGEYKKAVADCSKVLEHDDSNVSVLVQRALLYESMEKYRLGADDLRTVLKIDPGNRIARSTIHRLNKLAD